VCSPPEPPPSPPQPAEQQHGVPAPGRGPHGLQQQTQVPTRDGDLGATEGTDARKGEADVSIQDQSRCGDRGGKREAAGPEPAAELGIKAVVYIINNESITN